MARKKEWIGILLLVIALVGFGVWEKWGRDYFMTTEVVVANEEIPAGTTLSPELFRRAKVENSSVMENAITPEVIDLIRGKKASVTIPRNAQISTYQLRDADYYLAEGESVYVLKGEWITLRSSSLRRGDRIDLYSIEQPKEEQGNGPNKKTQETDESETVLGQYLGTYRVSFVKDTNECEVTNTADLPSSEFDTSAILSRSTSTAPVWQVEIIATAEEYAGILSAVRSAEEAAIEEYGRAYADETASLLIVQRFDGEVEG